MENKNRNAVPPTNLITYNTILSEGTVHAKGMPEGWITEKYGEYTVTWCPLNFDGYGTTTGSDGDEAS